MIWLKICFHVKLVLFWFEFMDWIELGGEVKIWVAIRDYILSPILPKSPPQTLISPPSHINVLKY